MTGFADGVRVGMNRCTEGLRMNAIFVSFAGEPLSWDSVKEARENRRCEARRVLVRRENKKSGRPAGGRAVASTWNQEIKVVGLAYRYLASLGRYMIGLSVQCTAGLAENLGAWKRRVISRHSARNLQ